MVTGDSMDFVKALTDLAAKNGWSKYKISKLTGYSQTTVANWMSGRSVPYPKERAQIAAALGTTTGYLFGDDTDIKKEPFPVQGGLTASEADIIRLYRAASPETQQSMLRFLRSLEADQLLRGGD